MFESNITLAAFFDVSDREQGKVSDMQKHATLAKLKDALSQEAQNYRIPKGFEEKVLEYLALCLNQLLDINIPSGILASAWSKLQELDEYCDKSKEDSGKAFLIPLVEHTVETQHNPSVEIVLKDNITVGRVDFQVDINFKIQGVILEVKDCKIERFTLGDCVGTGTLSCADIPIIERESKPLTFSGWIDLGKGIDICRHSSGLADSFHQSNVL